MSNPLEEARVRKIQMARAAYYRGLDEMERVALSSSGEGSQVEPPAGQGPSSSSTEPVQRLRSTDQCVKPARTVLSQMG